jgi:V-type H+-transporting ATPase subunit a
VRHTDESGHRLLIRGTGADNALVFTNSLKMKMSIVLGVIHMSFAICLQVPNHLHFKTPQYILVEWLPQIVFMESIFGARPP